MNGLPMTHLRLAAAFAVAVGLAGCGGGSTGNASATGQLRVALTDQAGTYDSVVLSIREVRVVPAGQENSNTNSTMPLVASFSPSRVVDVLTLSFQQQVLGTVILPAGNYHQLRLVLDANPAVGDPVNYLTQNGDPAKVALDTPSGQQSGLKILGDFAVAPGVLNVVVLDFDPAKAIVQAGASGKFLLKPTGVRIVQVSQSLAGFGSLSGAVLPAAAWDDAVVQVIPVGSAQAIAAGQVNPDDGTFRAFLPPGEYYVRVNATGFLAYDSRTLIPPGTYIVTVGADTSVTAFVLVP
ncbi:MAG: DUF4382 domain-containing protein [Armatimonadetes bacterium]|nr:DUF4382 domain-containing protein [Armatimonadota bacterium]